MATAQSPATPRTAQLRPSLSPLVIPSPHNRLIAVVLGAHDTRQKEDTWQQLKVIRQFPHPKYGDVSVQHDIMLLKLKEKANLTLAVGTLPLAPQFNVIPPGKMCRVAGWGRTNVPSLGSHTLQEVKLRVLEPQAWGHFPKFDHNLRLCVGNSRKTKSAFKVILGIGCFSTNHSAGTGLS
ncbi:chymase-like [Talpa occidentalis]|uniref:chymase-like n=1 Tax=Talpa occidentalis TaxID=50954 RepID=UPI00188F7A99|nr:chymase-like [Talpa occidentalis]